PVAADRGVRLDSRTPDAFRQAPPCDSRGRGAAVDDRRGVVLRPAESLTRSPLPVTSLLVTLGLWRIALIRRITVAIHTRRHTVDMQYCVGSAIGTFRHSGTRFYQKWHFSMRREDSFSRRTHRRAS